MITTLQVLFVRDSWLALGLLFGCWSLPNRYPQVRALICVDYVGCTEYALGGWFDWVLFGGWMFLAPAFTMYHLVGVESSFSVDCFGA